MRFTLSRNMSAAAMDECPQEHLRKALDMWAEVADEVVFPGKGLDFNNKPRRVQRPW